MFTATQLICHAIGDYVLQSDWMASNKTKSVVPALCHVITYALPFLFLRPSWLALAVIVSTHFVIDHWRLARYVVWAKNWIGRREPLYRCKRIIPVQEGWACGMPADKSERCHYHGATDFIEYKAVNLPFTECATTGYTPNTPPFMAVWLMIIVDNLMHVTINALALRYL
jgi:hypothetical protein